MKRPLLGIGVVLLWSVNACLAEAPASALDPQSAPAPEPGLLSRRIAMEEAEAQRPWVIMPYRPIYVLPFTYNSDINTKPIEAAGISTNHMKDIEIKFQFSLMVNVWQDAFWGLGNLYFAYTQISIWQAYDSEDSAPFRDTNYEPEMFLMRKTDYQLLGLHGSAISFGAVHQSNGRGLDALSRSWNRLYVNFLFDRGHFACSLRPWWMFPESEEESDRDVESYMGYGDFRAMYKLNRQEFALLFRNNLKSDKNRSTVQLDWTFPLTKYVKGYIQYFDGYGEVLLDYDHHDRRIGVGFLLNDWL